MELRLTTDFVASDFIREIYFRIWRLTYRRAWFYHRYTMDKAFTAGGWTLAPQRKFYRWPK